jgi:hypothetical protein
MTRPLSPAAEFIWEAYNDVMERTGVFEDSGHAIAAAIRAAADQVVPEESDLHPEEAGCLVMSNRQWQRCKTRSRLLAIAAELEGRADG